MKNLFKKVMATVLASAMVLSFVGCEETKKDDGKASIGVIQFATHASLDNCYKGFVEGLKEGGYVEGENLTIDFQNSMGEATNSDLYAKTMVDANVDLVAAIATPTAMSAYAATKEDKIPLIFTAVSDPVAAGIVLDMEKSGTNATGSSDYLDLDKQVDLIKAFLPDAKTIGVVYTTSEPNSINQLARLKEIAAEQGLSVEAIGITNSSELSTATTSLISKGVDCFNNFTDNNVVDNLKVMLNLTDAAKIPVFGSEEEQVKVGSLATQGIDYTALGKETGLMAAKVLKGEAKPEEMAVFVAKESQPFYNSDVAQKFDLEVPAEYSNAVDVAQ